MQMRQIWTRRWIAGNNTLHSSNWGGSWSQHSLLFCCFHKKACLCCGEVSPWSSSARTVLGHKQPLVPWHMLALGLHTHRACQGWHRTLHWERKEKPLSHFCWPHVWCEWRSDVQQHVTDFSGSDSSLCEGPVHSSPKKTFWERLISCSKNGA